MSLPQRFDDKRIAVIGGDRRMMFAAQRLHEAGATVSLFGFATDMGKEIELPVAPTFAEATEGASIILLPLPVTRDGVRVSCPFAPDSSVTLTDLADHLRRHSDTILFGGRIPPDWRAALSAHSLPPTIIDYETDEAFLLRNAYLTAEGALMMAGRETDAALRASSVAIIGYGRIGKLLARLLLANGVDVTVCARRRESLLWAETDGCHPILMGDPTRAGGGLYPLCCGHPVIFNTVPEPILHRDLLLRMEPDTLIIDLASPPYGIRDEDARAAEETNQLRYIRAPGIPGRYAPRDAGYAVADCVMDALRHRKLPAKGDILP